VYAITGSTSVESSSANSTSCALRADSSSRASASLPACRRWRSIDISGASPEPPPMSCSGPPWSAVHTNQPPTGPRTSTSSPGCASSTRYGETSPSSSRSTVTATPSPGAEEIE
jgi:hypothetical protein